MVKLALIGAGRWGTNIRRTLRAIRGASLTAVSATPLATKALLKRRDLDGVMIATPATTHENGGGVWSRCGAWWPK